MIGIECQFQHIIEAAASTRQETLQHFWSPKKSCYLKQCRRYDNVSEYQKYNGLQIPKGMCARIWING